MAIVFQGKTAQEVYYGNTKVGVAYLNRQWVYLGGGSMITTGLIDRTLTSYEIPYGVERIGDFAFYSCTSLVSVTIPDSVTSIGYNAFESCTSLKSVIIPDSVTSIGYYAFDSCTSLKSVIIPDSVTSLGISVFSDCTSLKSVYIPASVTSIKDSFYGCSNITDIYCGFEEDTVYGAPWGADNATVHYNQERPEGL